MKLELLKWEKEFASSIAKYANNPKIGQNLRDGFPYPYTLEDAQAYIHSCIQNEGNHPWSRAIVADGEPVGSMGVFRRENIYRRSGELGYWLAEEYWGQGIATHAVGMLCAEVFAHSDIIRIFAEPFAHNVGSRRVLEKNGFTLEGILSSSILKNGVVGDSCIYALVKE